LYGISQEEVTKNQRRLAKCVAEGTYVSTERGLVPIEQLAQAEPGEVSPLNCVVAQEGLERSQATGFYNGSTQPTIRITTERGYVLEATPQHRVRSLDENGDYVWRYLEELEAGSYVALARGAMMFGSDQAFNMVYERRLNHHFEVPDHLTPMFARFLGYFVAEGSYEHSHGSGSIVITNIDPDVLNDLRRISLEVFRTLPSEHVDKNNVTCLRWHSSRLTDLILHLGIPSGAENKRIPDGLL
jgi:intein/homing endonuclease